jgi:lipopolysaccharide/colanic/teichoic acid biosynthesis glycosyltransferase
MRIDAEANGPVWAGENDPRVTRVGRIIRKLRIDELPQFFNILRGEMSLIGPRPERPTFVKQLEELIPYYSERHLVKPGLTGWAQVCYPYGASFDDAREKHQYDLYYIKNQSPLLDAIIVLETARVVLFGRLSR